MIWGQLVGKALVSGVVIALASEVARRNPGWGGLIASLPLTTLLALIWLWRASDDPGRAADFLIGTVLYVIAALPALIGIAVLLRQGAGFAPSLGAGVLLAIGGYLALGAVGRALGWPV